MRRFLYRLHRWLGVHFGLLAFVICLSGTFAVLGHEWDWLLDPAWRAEPAPMDWAAAGRTLRQELPNHRVGSVRAPEAPGFAASALVYSSRGQAQVALLAPGTGKLQGVRNLLGAQFYLRQFHKSLLVPKSLYVLGLLGFLLLYSAISGLVIYRRWWKRLFRWRVFRGRHVRWTDLHRTTGVWLTLFALLIAVTVVWYWAEKGLRDVAGYDVQPEWPSVAVDAALADQTSRGEAAGMVPLGRLVQAAKGALEDFRPRAVHIPDAPDKPVRIDGQTRAILVRDRASRVYLHPRSAAVVARQRASDLGPLHRWSDMADPLHFGTLGNAGGLWSKLLYFVLGLALSLAILAGAMLALVRAPKRQRAARGGSARRWELVPTGITLALVLGSVVFTYMGWGHPLLRGRPPADAVTGTASAGPFAFRLTRHPGGDAATYVLHWEGEPPAHVDEVALTSEQGDPIHLHGWHRPHGSGEMRERVAVSIATRGGEASRARVTFGAPAAGARAFAERFAQLSPEPYAVGLVLGVLAVVLSISAAWVWLLFRPVALGPSSRGPRGATAAHNAATPGAMAEHSSR